MILKNKNKFVSSLLIASLLFTGIFSFLNNAQYAQAAANITVTSAKVTGPNQIIIVFQTSGAELTSAPITAYGSGSDGVAALTLTPGGVRNITLLNSLVTAAYTATYTFSGAAASISATASLSVDNPTDISDFDGNTLNPAASPIELSDGQKPVFVSATTVDTTHIAITFSEPIYEEGASFTPGDFTIGGATVLVTAFDSVFGSVLTLTLNNPVNGTDDLTVTYTKGFEHDGIGDDIAPPRNLLADFGPEDVENTLFAGGDGTEGEPYQISNCLQLQNMNLYLDAFYILNNDIDCAETATWNEDQENPETYFGFEPIGNGEQAFFGNFNGQGYKITGLYINRDQNHIGLFGLVGVEEEEEPEDLWKIADVGLEDVDITGNSFVGGLVGYSNGSIENSYATGDVSGGERVGGLVGWNNGSIENSYATGDVSGGEVSYNIGGLVGVNNDTITNSYATGDVSGINVVGGLVGDHNGGSITNAYATGDVSGSVWVGGLVGQNSTTITNSYSIGKVTLNEEGDEGTIGGFVGYNDNSTISNSFWDTETSGQDDGCGTESSECDGVTGKTTTQMKKVATFIRLTNEVEEWINEGLEHPVWDFVGNLHDDGEDEDYWDIDGVNNSGYPFLSWQEFEEPEPEPPRRRSSGSYASPAYLALHNITLAPITPPTDCKPGYLFSALTGKSCGVSNNPQNLTPNTLSPSAPSNNNFTRTLKFKMTGDDVLTLQKYLNTHGFPLATTGVGSSGYETKYFGALTLKAVKAFQKANGLTPDGIVGPLTQAKIKSLP